MTRLVQPRLINPPFEDPGLYIDFRFGRRAILFDLGDVSALSPRELLRVSHVFVSHAHMDHFAGFDRLLRVCLRREKPLHLVGPERFIERVANRLASYTWNLLDDSSADFRISVAEFGPRALARGAEFRAREAFAPRVVAPPPLADGVVLDEEDFRIEARVLDHGIPVLAFRLREKMRVNVIRSELERHGLEVGPWLTRAKQAVRRGVPDDTTIEVGARRIRLAELRDGMLRIAPGQAIAYVVDCAYTSTNSAAVLELIAGAEQLFIEAAFLQQDAPIAAARAHLTAEQAGELARRAGVARLTPFHFSPRYLDRPHALAAEAQAAFRGKLRP